MEPCTQSLATGGWEVGVQIPYPAFADVATGAGKCLSGLPDTGL